MIGRLRSFASGPAPTVTEAAGILRLVYVLVFAAQALLALVVGTLLAVFVPARGAANDVVAIVLLVMALFHLPLGWVLGGAAVRAGGRQGALSGIIATAVMLSIPAWFGVLMLVSGQRPPYLTGIVVIVAVGYALGFLLSGTAASVAATDDPPVDGPDADAPTPDGAGSPRSPGPHVTSAPDATAAPRPPHREPPP